MPESITQWLERFGLGQYATNFVESDIDWDVLPELDEETLEEIGVSSTGDRLRINGHHMRSYVRWQQVTCA